jgi:hypothetical protein
MLSPRKLVQENKKIKLTTFCYYMRSRISSLYMKEKCPSILSERTWLAVTTTSAKHGLPGFCVLRYHKKTSELVMLLP